jgi:signal transduction histidine kinase/ActR/RegA family two-component response regulator
MPAPRPIPPERAYRVLVSTGQACWERNLRTGEASFSPDFFAQLGIAPTGDRDTINAHVHPDDRPAFEAAYAAAIEKLGPFSYELRILRDDGSWQWRRAHGRVWPGADGRAEWLAGVLVDVHGEKTALQALEAMAERYARTMAASSEAHFERTVGRDDFFVSTNLPAMLGHPPGTPPPDAHTYFGWVHPDDLPGLLDRMRAARAGPGPWEAIYRMRTVAGEWRWFRGRGRTERQADGALRMSGMVGDIHELVLAREELERHRSRLQGLVEERTARLDAALQEAERQKAQADAANRAKSQFIAHMSHEIRTPLNGVLGLTELALRSAETPAQRRYLEVGLRSGQALLGLVTNVLDLAQIESGRPALADLPFDVSELLADVLRGVAATASAKGLALRFDWTAGPTWARGDAVRLRQVATNLVGNAIKFTPAGQVRLIAWMTPPDAGVCTLRFRVEDTGPGIAPALAARVFTAFVQGDASLSRRHGGAGLGLTIARQLAEAMGGRLELLPATPDAPGASFLVTLPMGAADEPAPVAPPPPGLLWVVHADPTLPAWFERRFGRLGWRVLGVGDAAGARRHAGASTERPQLVVAVDPADHAAADLAALQAALPGVPVTLMVRPDWDEPAVERMARQAGMGIALHPATPRDLATIARGSTPARAPVAASSPVAGTALGEVLLVEDNPVNLVVVAENLRQLGFAVRVAEDGQRALAECAQHAPRLVLMDLQMPVMDGVEATRRLRGAQAAGGLPGFPIVGLTAHALRNDHDDAIAAGMDLVLTKPILRDALVRALAKFVPELAPEPVSR